MLVGQLLEGIGNRHRRVANHVIAADQVGIGVDEDHGPARKQALLPQVEEHCATAEERLDVRPEVLGVVRPQRRQQLAFSANPFEEGFIVDSR
ncbi:MAG: hypothetical protein U0Q11_18235 [Vicinamibacterales bacterium]